MPDSASPLLIQLTPPGRGAVASLRIEGADGVESLADVFVARNSRPLAEIPLRQIAVGRVGGEEVVLQPAFRRRDRGSLPRRHGRGRGVKNCSSAADVAKFLGGTGPLCMSRTSSPPPRKSLWPKPALRTAAILLDQYNGALRKAFERIEASLKSGDAISARQQADALLAHAATGLHLLYPWQVVIAGRPNVGKSSLINAIAGYQRAIVHNLPGTTRDIVAVQTALDGWPVEISDTAGLRRPGDPIEQAGIELANEKIAAADLLVLVFDASLPWTAADQALVDAHPSALLVGNRERLAASVRPASRRLGRQRGDIGRRQRTLSDDRPAARPPSAAARRRGAVLAGACRADSRIVATTVDCGSLRTSRRISSRNSSSLGK